MSSTSEPTTGRPATDYRTSSNGNGRHPTDDPPPSAFETAHRLTAAGRFCVPLENGTKAPSADEWQLMRLTVDQLPTAFKTATGCGVLTGLKEDPLADVDCDCQEAITAAPFFLPAPDARHGRPSRRGAHYWYRTKKTVKTRKFLDPVLLTHPDPARKKKAMVVELRGPGLQTMVPPAFHTEAKERLEWEIGSLEQIPAEIEGEIDLAAPVARVAAAALLARYWPGEGARQEAAGALSGFLLRVWSVEDTEQFVRAVVQTAGDEEAEKRIGFVAGTAAKIAAGEDVTGRPTLEQLLGENGPAVVKAVTKWLGIQSPASTAAVTDGQRGQAALWQEWIGALEEIGARLIWADGGAYVQVPSGELWPLESDSLGLWLQERCDREAAYGSEKFRTAAGAARSYIRQYGEKAQVFRIARTDFPGGKVWIGCEDGTTLYRITAKAIERVPNGTDGVLIRDGIAPALDIEALQPAGEIARFLKEGTWAKPIARLALSVEAVEMALGAGAFDARPITLAKGPKGSGKTTTLQMLGQTVYGVPTIAQAIKSKEEQNESRIVNERFAVFDNLDAPPRGLEAEDFLATAATQQLVSIRKMRTEGEVVQKPVTAFIGVTSFTIPDCLKRADVMDRTLVCEFEKADDAGTATMKERAPDRALFWTDLLLLLQRAVTNWQSVPKASAHRSIEFVQFAHALLGKENAERLEQSLIALQARTAGADDPILLKIQETPPPGPMTARDLWDWWWKDADPDRPKSPGSLGKMLGYREGPLGAWRVCKTTDSTNTTYWKFTGIAAVEGLTDEAATAILDGLMTDPPPTPSGDRILSPSISGLSPTLGSCLERRYGDSLQISLTPELNSDGGVEGSEINAGGLQNQHSISLSPQQPQTTSSTGTGDRPEIDGDRKLSPETYHPTHSKCDGCLTSGRPAEYPLAVLLPLPGQPSYRHYCPTCRAEADEQQPPEREVVEL